MGSRNQKQGGAGLEAQRSKLGPPRMYKVLLLNDDFTPMDFVIVVLEKFFGMNREKATLVMLAVHPRDLAATKVEQVSAFARQQQHPLACVMEEN